MSEANPREVKREAIVDAAARVFAGQGFARARIADIATGAGVGKGTVYEYFASKEELFFAAFEQNDRRVRSRITGRLERGGTVLDQLAAVLDEAAAIVTDLREVYALNLEFWAACRGGSGEHRFKDAVEGLYEAYRTLLADLLVRGQETGEIRRDLDARAVAAIVVGAVDGLGIQHWIDPSFDPRHAVTCFHDLLSSGLDPEQT